MTITCYQIDDCSQLQSLAPEEAVSVCQQKDACAWLDIEAPTSDELAGWLDQLSIQGLIRRICLEARTRPGFYPLKQEVCLVIPVLNNPEDVSTQDYLVIVCHENLLLTVHGESVMNQEDIAELQATDDWLPERSIAGLVSAIMIELSLRGIEHTTNLHGSILTLEERMDRQPETVKAEEILDKRSELLERGSMISDQLPVLQALHGMDRPFFQFNESQTYMNCALVNLQAAAASMNWLDGRVSGLRSGFEMHAQDNTNRRLNMLTILSAVFNPATLLAGIWGMNFAHMPELQYKFAYPIALSLMALIGVFMVLFFRRGGWFD
ncbi:magnesium transporter CorA family protein [Planctomycetota bacterium]